MLIKEGVERKYRYRFRNPPSQPYVILRGIKDGAITGDAVGKRFRDG